MASLSYRPVGKYREIYCPQSKQKGQAGVGMGVGKETTSLSPRIIRDNIRQLSRLVKPKQEGKITDDIHLKDLHLHLETADLKTYKICEEICPDSKIS